MSSLVYEMKEHTKDKNVFSDLVLYLYRTRVHTN